MDTIGIYLPLADAVLVLHTLVVVFIIGGQCCVLIGAALGWSWVRNLFFRIVHLVAIVMVMLQAWLGVLCPLTTLEMYLRKLGGGDPYEGGFIAHWLGKVLYYDAPAWAFVIAYSLFAVLVAASWFFVRPVRKR